VAPDQSEEVTLEAGWIRLFERFALRILTICDVRESVFDDVLVLFTNFMVDLGNKFTDCDHLARESPLFLL
jgi:hypothetical protein